MTLKLLAFTAAVGILAAGAAQARDAFDEVYFVRPHASAADLLQDRAACRSAAEHMSDTDAAYSNPEYGALSAMGSALDEDALHEGGLHRRLQRAVFEHCMKDKAWVLATPSEDELKVLTRASSRHPEALDAWLRAHEPPPPAPAAPATAVVKTEPPAAAPVKTAVSASTTEKSAN